MTSIDSATAEPYQFKIFIEGRKAAPEVWTLKARTEVSQVFDNCSMVIVPLLHFRKQD